MSAPSHGAILLFVVGLAILWLAAVAVWNTILAFVASPWFLVAAAFGVVVVVLAIILRARS